MLTSKKLTQGALLLCLIAVTGCSHVDDFPMYNRATGEKVTCHSGVYWLLEDHAEERMGEQCIASCKRHGFELLPSENIEDHGLLRFSPEDVRSLTPIDCLP